MILAVSRNQLISTTRRVRVVLGQSWDQVGIKLGPSRGQVAEVVRQYCAAAADADKHYETTGVPSLRIGGSQ